MNPASAWKEDIMYNGEWLAWGVFKENAFTRWCSVGHVASTHMGI